MTRHQPGLDGDDFDALDFSYSGGSAADDGDAAEADPLDFASDAAGDAAATFDEVPDYSPEHVDHHATALDAIDSAAEVADDAADEDALPLFTVTNPPGTVSVSAAMDGTIQRVELSPKLASGMSESELAGEILVIADLARQKGLAGQHAFILEQVGQTDVMRELGEGDIEGLSRFLAMPEGVSLPTSQQAAAAEAEVFATRYAAE